MTDVNNNIMHEIIIETSIIVLNGSRENTVCFCTCISNKNALITGIMCYVCHLEMTTEKKSIFINPHFKNLKFNMEIS